MSAYQDARAPVALVTGATSGFGREVARTLAAQGFSVLVHGRDAGRGAAVVREIAAAGGQARFIAADLADTDAVKRLAEDAGEVDVLVNNAGFSWFGSTVDLDPAVFDQLFARFPNVRIASVENGSEFLRDLFRKLRSASRKLPGFFAEDPVETFRRNIWVNPFWEDDVNEVVELMGADRVIFGSDWPHIEGMPKPLDYVAELKELDDASRRLVMRDNARALNQRIPTGVSERDSRA